MFSTLIDQFWSLTLSGIALGFIYVLISLGYTMVYGVLRMINFANSEIFMFGTFATIIISRDFLGNVDGTKSLPLPKLILTITLCLLGSMLVSGLVAVFVELVAYRRLRARGTNKLATLISAIGISIVLSEFMRIITNSRPTLNPRVLEKKSLFEIAGASFRIDTVLTIIFAAVLFFVLDRFVKYSRLGRAIRAVSMNEDASRLMGVNLNLVVSGTFLVGGLMTGAAGFFYILKYENTSFNIGFELGIAAFTAAILGGIGNIKGAFYGGIGLGLIETYASFFLGTQWKAVTVFVILVVVLYFRPNGVFGEAITQSRA